MRRIPLMIVVIIAALTALASFASWAAPPATLANGDFRQGLPGAPPSGWALSGARPEDGFRCWVENDPGQAGVRCAVLAQEPGRAPAFGNLMQTLSAAPYRGKRVRLSTWLRLESTTAGGPVAQAWLRVDRPGQRMGFFDNMQERPAAATTWTSATIVGDVAPDAEELALGVFLPRGGRVWIAPVTLEILGETPAAPAEGPRALTPAGLANLEALARVVGYVRYFHPSDGAAGADWNRLAVAGVRQVEGAACPAERARRLQALVAPVAPTVQVLAPGQDPALLEAPAGAASTVAWVHHGLGRALGAAALDPDGTAFLGTLRRMVAGLQDGHGRVQSGLDAEAVPDVDVVLVDGVPVVRAAREVPAGSRILAVDGEPSEARLARLRLEISAATPGWMDTRLEMEFLKGGPAPVRVRLRRPDGSECEAALPRLGTEPDPEAPWRCRPGRICELRPGIWYVDLDRAGPSEFQEALPRLAQARGVVFDLRGYPKMDPGFLQHLGGRTLRSAIWCVPVATRPDRRDWRWTTSGRWRLEPRGPRLTGKVVFLAGGGTISYAESCLGIVEAYRLGEIVGATSAGTNGNCNDFTLPGGYSVSWTGMKVLRHDGTRHHGVGIRPGRAVRPTLEGLAQGRDEVLEAGLAAAASGRPRQVR